MRDALGAGLLGLLLSGCHSGPAELPDSVPYDFVLSVRVWGAEEAEAPHLQSGRYRVGVNRRLRAGGTDEAPAGRMPIVAVMAAERLGRIYRLIRARHLLTEPTSPRAARLRAEEDVENGPASRTLYSVRIECAGRTHRYHTTPAESPPTARLVRRLLEAMEGGGGS